MATGQVQTALTTLGGVLTELSAALASGRSDVVWAVEARVAGVVAELRVAVATVSSVGLKPDGSEDLGSEEAGDLTDQIGIIREEMMRCRRLGGTVPALLSVMFPGRVGYGRDGHATLGKGL